MRGSPPAERVSLSAARSESRVRALAISRSVRLRRAGSMRVRNSRIMRSTSRLAYQTARLPSWANSRIACRYERTVRSRMFRRARVPKPFSRPAISTLATSRLTSHSQGPGSVSSKSFRLKTMRRSGVAKTPKFARCASPHTWARKPLVGVSAKSLAMTIAAPRKKANGDSSMRPCRTGTRSGTRVVAWPRSSSTGSGRVADTANSP